ncbi:unnamed protein product [Cylindrotheca closterium]|uniref:non-specific serine/threonine protein kinase n=1 Tax=Cylindrotheca closterium TaxID=2856 RepID=A0AAD2FKZ6_9STRA|nr:unnamed protein product [Cylindrotheca closterium]
MPATDGGLGEHIVGDKVVVGKRNITVNSLLDEGGFSYVYLADSTDENGNQEPQMVLKVTSIHSRSQRDIAEKEAKLLMKLSHPSIIKIYDNCYASIAHNDVKKEGSKKERPQHLILMEYCEGGHALGVCNRLAAAGERFDLSTLVIAFGQICNAVSYLHAQRPPVVHRDLKPVNFLVKNGAYKLCDFGSAVFGHVDLKSAKAKAEQEEVIQKTTTQMFRAPEMVDLYMAKKLTQATDVWALGCCLYSLAFLKNCFEEGSNLAILSGKYTIPEDNPYGDGLVELLDRMLASDSKERADMTEVILCLSAVYSGRPLPPRKKKKNKEPSKSKAEKPIESKTTEATDEERIGTFRTDGQGVQEAVYDPTKATEGKKLASNSVAARRKRAAASGTDPKPQEAEADFGKDQDFAFAADFGGFEDKGDGFFDSPFDAGTNDANNEFEATFDTAFDSGFGDGGGGDDPFKSGTSNFDEAMGGLSMNDTESSKKSKSKDSSKKPKSKSGKK